MAARKTSGRRVGRRAKLGVASSTSTTPAQRQRLLRQHRAAQRTAGVKPGRRVGPARTATRTGTAARTSRRLARRLGTSGTTGLRTTAQRRQRAGVTASPSTRTRTRTTRYR